MGTALTIRTSSTTKQSAEMDFANWFAAIQSPALILEQIPVCFDLLPKNQQPHNYKFLGLYKQINSLPQTVPQTAQLLYLCA